MIIDNITKQKSFQYVKKRRNKKVTILANSDKNENLATTKFSKNSIIIIHHDKNKSKENSIKKLNFFFTKNKKYNLSMLLEIINIYYEYLYNKKFKFNDFGLPIFDKKYFLDDIPKKIVPYFQRLNNSIGNKKETLLCFYDNDKHLYPRLIKIFDEIDEYKKYAGIISLDITITNDMDSEWQKIILLVNLLFTAILAVNGVKIVFNTRSANVDTKIISDIIPKNVICASGFLGCKKIDNNYDYSYLSKILTLSPSTLIIYGKQDKIIENQLSSFNITYIKYKDFHRYSKEAQNGRLQK